MGGVHRLHATARVLPMVLLVALLALAPTSAAGAADKATTTTAVRSDDIIPEPNSGAEPDDAGDRGGALQTAIFVGIIGAVLGAGGWLVVQSRRARADRGF